MTWIAWKEPHVPDANPDPGGEFHRTCRYRNRGDWLRWPFDPVQDSGIENNETRHFEVESEMTGGTASGAIYAAGDDVRGADLLVTAIAVRREAAQARDSHLGLLP